MATTLDRSKPFATVFYDEFGRAFEQDGQFFTGTGALWVEPVTSGAAPEAPPAPAPAPKAVKAKAPASARKAPATPEDEQLAAQMAGA